MRLLAILLLSLCFAAACNRNPDAAKRKYVNNGNKYFERSRYKEALIMYRKALQQDGKFGEAYYRSALAELQLQRFGEAARNLQRSVELQPTNLDAHEKLTELYLTAYLADPKRPKGFLDELNQLSEKFAARFPDSFERERLDGYLALFDKDRKGALAHFAKANQIKPNQPELVLAYMQVLAAEGRADEGEKLAYQVLKNDPHALAIYDMLYVQYVIAKRLDDAERILKSKVENNPKSAQSYLKLAEHYYGTQRRPEMLALLKKVSSNGKDFPEGPKLVGDFFVRAQELDMAAASYLEGVSRGGADKPMYQKRLVEALFKQKKKDEAAKLISEVLKENPKDDEAIAIRGAMALSAGTKEQIQNAINDLQSVTTRMPGNPVVRLNLGQALLAKGNTSAARVQLEEAVKLMPSFVAPRILLAEIMLASKDYAKALQMSKEIMDYDSANVPARLIRSRALMSMGNMKQAREDLRKTAEQHPEVGDAKLQLAALDLSEKNYKTAEETFRQLYSSSQDPRAFMGLIESYVAQRQTDQAIKALREEMSKHPERVEYRATLANIAAGTKDYGTAITEYKKVLESSPRSAGIWQRLGEVYRRSGDTGAAVGALRKAQEVAPQDVNSALQLAMLYESTGQKGQARPLYEQALRIQPENPVALNNLAYMLADTGQDLDQALTMIQKAKQQSPKNNEISDTLGWVYIKKNLPDSAIGVYRDLVAQDPSRATYRYHFAVALAQKGDKTAAKKELEAALRSKPDKNEEVQIRELMSQIS